jgi:hypothetical protein
MIRSSRPLTVARRGFLVAATAGALALAGSPAASAAVAPAAPAPLASPGTGIPVFGGLIDSVVGIVTGTAIRHRRRDRRRRLLGRPRLPAGEGDLMNPVRRSVLIAVASAGLAVAGLALR